MLFIVKLVYCIACMAQLSSSFQVFVKFLFKNSERNLGLFCFSFKTFVIFKIRAPAEAEKYRLEKIAEAEKSRTVLEAEAEVTC